MHAVEPLLQPQPSSPEQPAAWLAAFERDGLVVLPEYLTADLCHTLLQEVQQQAELTPAAIGRGQQRQHASDIRRDKTCWLDGSTVAQQRYMLELNTILSQLNRHFFLGLTGYECHFAHYQPGDFYRTHLDAFNRQASRQVTSVCYLNDVQDGGELVLYDEQHTELMQLPPRAGSLILFESSRFPHQVLPTRQDRFSIAGWFRRDDVLL
ncbi:2OG-Fe(II) oxygenase [Alkalimonas amylolytica]|uniref:SM-20-related protein n=1 Tax=Alkalimonas amylolytica TaxID=152573 RepID=A0A1H4E094_ALKAM|nr:2OG-Fe(II) oxygenase [Alkalimonas amylolytica]SEA78178.1 SM-20-related protein [Alkalimonas amylolytica]